MSHAAVFAQNEPVIPQFGRGSDCVRENGTFCWGWFQDNWADTFQPALLEHIWLTFLAVSIGFVIAFVAALIAYRMKWFEGPFTLLTGILYTIPSLALFQLLVPVTGLSTLTVEIALVSYTLLIIFRNTLLGLRGVPEDVREAARGMGLTDNQMLLKVDLPLALPAIIAGVRVATVTIVSLATIAAFIVDQGLGGPIREAIQKNFNTEFIAAGVLAVALALVLDGLLVIVQRLLTPWARRRTAVNDFTNAIEFIGNNTGLLWDKVVEHLELSFAALGVAILIAVPLGVWLGHIHRGSFIAINIANIGRALPSLAVIAINIAIIGLGFANVMVALVILAVPIILTNAYVAVDGVDRDAVEAAKGMGMRGRDVLTRIELPLALPLIFAGIRTATVYVIATATLAAIAGGGGLGDIIVNQASYRIEGVIAGAMVVAGLAFAAELGLAGLQRLVTPRGLREAKREQDVAPLVGPAMEGST